MNTYKFELDRFKDKIWHLNNNWHRDYDRPAYISYGGSKVWCQYSKEHRANDKPAIICSNGSIEYWVNGERIK
jgi:hypothetical protein